MNRRVQLLLLALVVAVRLQAQQCERTDRVLACWERFNPSQEVAKAESTAATQKTVAATNSGLPALISPSGSALKDFLSLLSASLESSSLSSNGNVLTFDYNPPVEILGLDHALKLQAVFGDAKLNSQLTDHFASSAASTTKLNDSLTNTDEVSLSGSFQPTSERFGRSIKPHRALFESMLLAQVITPDSSASDAALSQALDDENLQTGDEKKTFLELKNNDLSEANALKEVIEAAARAQQALNTRVSTLTTRFAQLLNNQPQLYGTALYNARKNIVGPNQWTAKFTYEMGARNLNGFRGKYGGACNEIALATDAAAAERCAGLLQTFAGGDVIPDDRLAISISYDRTNRRWIKGDPNLSGFEFGYPRAHNLVYEV